MRLLIVEDEYPARERIRQLAAAHADLEVIGEAITGPDAVHAIETLKPDLVLLDVALPLMDGFEVLSCAGLTPLPLVVFTTAFDAHALRAFEAEAVDYLLKPVDHERFDEAMRRARSKLLHRHDGEAALRQFADAAASNPGRIVVRHDDRIVFLRPEEIDVVESVGNYVSIHRGTERFLLRQTLSATQERLRARGFVRIQRSVLVNAERIAELRRESRDSYLVVLANGARYRLSPNYREDLEKALGKF